MCIISVISVMLYVRKRDEQIYTPLHIVPPSLTGLIQAVGEKFGVESEKVNSQFELIEEMHGV